MIYDFHRTAYTPLMEGQRCVDPELKKGTDPQLPGLS